MPHYTKCNSAFGYLTNFSSRCCAGCLPRRDFSCKLSLTWSFREKEFLMSIILMTSKTVVGTSHHKWKELDSLSYTVRASGSKENCQVKLLLPVVHQSGGLGSEREGWPNAKLVLCCGFEWSEEQ